MKKTLGFFTATLIVITSVTACGGVKTIHASDDLLIYHYGRQLSVEDRAGGAIYRFDVTRTTREQAAESRTLIETATLSVSTAGGALIVIAHRSGEKVVIVRSTSWGRRHCNG